MSKHKKKLTSEQRTQRAQNAQKVIANARKPRLMIKDLPGWMQNAALNRFNWLRWLPFIPLLIVLLTAPMLQNEVPATLKATGGMINKNALFLVPFACLLGAYGCWIAIKSRRRADHVDGDVNRFALMEMETIIGDLLVILICTVISIWQVFVAFH
ncbi:hypothetical protein JIO05_00855 [Pediococcus acidilactici]|jgi:hypothetical protein|uniref:hypothetical protein n=1 Tax=Pediococcus acidilactici TaxID=1254 RepID=UPI0006B69410|nr:hypothetical protein [Pediococcus acidilactici]KAF0371045.1 hypothetical protein GBO58_08370 [Pediococcus acidilactici]KAF0382286.1 hypothetical protein GBO62_08285 [Pediococcus acidilactici]KAF0455808.1 hypothetical protein GBP02_08300 [Pediococcus acidilactici]KAF0475602.1 hypothetical protein GBP10_08580 [Pediococcus acidilactici]KAF0535582.1 hypothetical protein GBP37_08590 [Pediococcus acidilactici]